MLRTLLAAGLLLSLASCDDYIRWSYHIHSVRGVAELVMPGANVRFENVKLAPLPGPNQEHVSGWLTLRSTGSDSLAVTLPSGLVFTSSYAAGVNEMKFGGVTMQIWDEGDRLTIGKRSFSMTGAKPTIVIKADGIAYLEGL